MPGTSGTKAILDLLSSDGYRMTSEQIKKLLENRAFSRQELMFCELKLHYDNSKQRLDAWSIKPNWKQDQTTGYEIKVSRQDFIRDDKWQSYLDCCNQFYFVCPKNLIHKEEVPERAGLLYASEKRITTIKVAPYRAKEFDPFLIGIIINRMKTDTERERAARIKTIKEMLDAKKEARIIGNRLGLKFSQEIEEQLEKNHELYRKIEQLEEVKSFCDSMGIDTSYADGWKSYLKQIKERLDTETGTTIREKENIDNELLHVGLHIERAKRNMEECERRIEEIKKRITWMGDES